MVARTVDREPPLDSEQVARQELLNLYGVEYLQKLLQVDATPPEDDEKIPSDKESKYQKRRWFGRVLMSLDLLFPDISDPKLREKLADAKILWTSDEFTLRARPTYPEDIEYADNLITEVLNYFENQN